MCIKSIIIETEDKTAMTRWVDNFILLRNIPKEFKEYFEDIFSVTIDEVGYDVLDANTKELIEQKRWYAIKRDVLPIKIDWKVSTPTDYFYLCCEKLSEIYKDYLYTHNMIELSGSYFSKRKGFNGVVMNYSNGFYPVEDGWFRE